MTYPPSTIAADKTNNTPVTDDHPAHHDSLANAVNDIVAELGDTVKGASATLKARLAALDTTVAGKEAAGVAAALVDDLSGVTDAATARTNLGLGSLATKSAVASADITDGTIVNADISGTAAIALSKLATDPLARANHTGTQTMSTISDAGTLATLNTVGSAQITDGSVTNSDLANMANATVKGRNTAGTGAPEDVTMSQLKTLLALGESDITNLVSDLAAKAALASPALTGTPTVPTAAQGTNTTQAASTAYVQTEVGLLVPKSVVTTKGDLIAGTGSSTVARLAVAATDDMILAGASGQSTGLQWKARTPPSAQHLVSGALAASFDRQGAAASAQAILTSGTLFLFQITLAAGQVITSISMRSGNQAAVSPTHQFFGIADINRAVQRWTSDDTTTAWAATTVKTLNLTSTYTVPTSGDYYLALMVSATTAPNIISFNGLSGNLTNIAPFTCGNTTDTGLTTPPTLPFTAGAITAGTQAPYAWVA